MFCKLTLCFVNLTYVFVNFVNLRFVNFDPRFVNFTNFFCKFDQCLINFTYFCTFDLDMSYKFDVLCKSDLFIHNSLLPLDQQCRELAMNCSKWSQWNSLMQTSSGSKVSLHFSWRLCFLLRLMTKRSVPDRCSIVQAASLKARSRMWKLRPTLTEAYRTARRLPPYLVLQQLWPRLNEAVAKRKHQPFVMYHCWEWKSLKLPLLGHCTTWSIFYLQGKTIEF